MSIVDDIYQVFIDYFGEEKVDKQIYSNSNPIEIVNRNNPRCYRGDYIILVHWPTVTVTNEYDEHVDIWDLFAATVISPEGKLRTRPTFTRSTYDKMQWKSSYMHSHIASINKERLNSFRESCLGSGPINSTIEKLQRDSYTDTDVWNLYCWELDKYVAVESISGVPYKRLQTIGIANDGSPAELDKFNIEPTCPFRSPAKLMDVIKDFVTFLIQNKVLKFNYCNGVYGIASPYAETVLQISNAFIHMYNTNPAIRKTVSKEELFERKFIEKKYIKNGVVYDLDTGNIPIEVAIGTYMFNFKGNPVTLQLKDYHQSYESSEVYLLNLRLINFIVFTLLKYVNLKYGKESDATDKKVKVI